MSIELFALTMILALAVVEPQIAHRHLRALKRDVEYGDRGARTRTYRRTIWSEWLAAIGFTAVWLFAGRPLEQVGFALQAVTGQWIAIGVAAALLIAVAVQSRRAETDPEALRSVRDQLGNVSLVAPKTAAELTWFKWLSLTAGICEEVLYRGLLMGALALTLGTWPAVLISSVAFGLGHSYQGPAGVLRTGLIGVALAVLTVLTGSIYAAIVAHVLLDLLQGNMIHAAMNLPADEATSHQAA